MLNVLTGLAGKLLPEAGKILDELVTSGEEKASAKQKLEELFVRAEADAQKEVTERGLKRKYLRMVPYNAVNKQIGIAGPIAEGSSR